MKIHQPRSAASEIEELYAIALREHGPQARSSTRLRQELEIERRRGAGADSTWPDVVLDAGVAQTALHAD